jgi:hypothetical protein
MGFFMHFGGFRGEKMDPAAFFHKKIMQNHIKCI